MAPGKEQCLTCTGRWSGSAPLRTASQNLLGRQVAGLRHRRRDDPGRDALVSGSGGGGGGSVRPPAKRGLCRQHPPRSWSPDRQESRLEADDAELMGRKTGLCQGKGGHMHLFSAELHYGCGGIIGGGIPHATGAALAFKKQKREQRRRRLSRRRGRQHWRVSRVR